MKIFCRLTLLLLLILPMHSLAQSKLKFECNVEAGETLTYKATWGFLTIGTATTKIDKTIYKVGANPCYKIDITGRTNGLAKLFYVNDKWTSFIDTATITTHKSFRSIREGHYELDEQVHFDHENKKAEVKIFDKTLKSYKLKKVYDTPESIRDIVAGVMVFRLVDLSRFKKGDRFSINGFYEDEGYKIDVVFMGEEYVKIKSGKVLCYKVKPVLPKNNVFDGKDAVEVWLAANKSKSIIRIRAKMFVGNVNIDLQ